MGTVSGSESERVDVDKDGDGDDDDKTVGVNGDHRVSAPVLPDDGSRLYKRAKSGDDIILDLFTAKIDDKMESTDGAESGIIDKVDDGMESMDVLEEVVMEMAVSGDELILDVFDAESLQKEEGTFVDGGDEIRDDGLRVKGNEHGMQCNEDVVDSSPVLEQDESTLDPEPEPEAEAEATELGLPSETTLNFVISEEISFSVDPLSVDPDLDPDPLSLNEENNMKSPFPTVSPMGSIVPGVNAVGDIEIVVDDRSEIEVVESPMDSVLSQSVGSPDPMSLHETGCGVDALKGTESMNGDIQSPLDLIIEQSKASQSVHSASGSKTVDVDQWMHSEKGNGAQSANEEEEEESMASEIIYESANRSEIERVEEALNAEIFGNAEDEEDDEEEGSSEEENESAYSNATDPNQY